MSGIDLMSAESPESTETIETFISRWETAEAAERANYQMFLTELCDLLELAHPDPTSSSNNTYTFEKAIAYQKPDGNSTTVYADLYKKGHFVLETKQGAHAKKDNPDQLSLLDVGSRPRKTGHGVRGTRQWDIALEKAYNQARGYIRFLPAEEGRPPFLMVCDVGYVIELYSEFTCTGGTYVRFPDPKNHRIYLEDLRKIETRDLLRTIWTDPLSMDPSKHAARVTREVAWHLAELAKSLEKDGHSAQAISTFLQRSLFTMFAEDVGLLPDGAYVGMLERLKEHPEGFAITVTNLWKDMSKEEEWSVALMQKIAYFNGGLFEKASALPLNSQQIALLIGAAKPDWSDVEPAIFGTLLERALDPRERHKLGAYYTPRSYVERLVKPTIIDPLRSRWDAVKTAAAQYQESEETEKALEAVKEFHHYLCRIRILDPACGSGNFLYVTLEHMKRLEGEVLELLEALGDDELTFEMEHFKVRPQQFWGLEINERAVAIAQLVLWIGYFQWHKKTTGNADTKDRPLLPKQQTILHQDAVLAYDQQIPRKDEDGNFVTIWDGRTTKAHPVTGKEVPDDTARIPVYDYTNPRRAEWPEADFVVGNPPFIGKVRMREYLGDGYIECLRKVWKNKIPESADFVMFWWEKASELLRAGRIQRFGFITTNSIHQTFNRRVVEKHLNANKDPLFLAFTIPDHPWVDSVDGAAVRIAMTVLTTEQANGELNRVTSEREIEDKEHEVELQSTFGKINEDLKIGPDLNGTKFLISNSRISCLGLILGGKGFKVDRQFVEKVSINDPSLDLIFPIWNGSDLTSRWAGNFVIDAFGLAEDELRFNYPTAWQHLKDHVYDIRQTNRDPKLRKNWWLFRRANTEFRNSTANLARFIVTSETAKHRVFQFLGGNNKPEHKLVVLASDDSLILGIVSTSVHVAWALNCGGRLGFGNDPVYVKTRCFETFPFPDLSEADSLKSRIRDQGEQLDLHRKRQQIAHPVLTLTGIYNVLEKLRQGEALNAKEKKIHDDGLVSVLKQIHDDLDDAVLEAYGWEDLKASMPLADRLAQGDEQAEALEQDILQRLVDLNHERAAEEKRGLIRWLRPEYQNPDGSSSESTSDQSELAVATPAAKATKQSWPKDLPDQVTAIRQLLPETGPDPSALATHFGKRTKKRLHEIEQILATLQNLGQL